MRLLVLSAAVGLALTASVAIAPQPTSTPQAPSAISAVQLSATVQYKFKNCTAMNKVYKHGVGKSTAKDKTSGKRVTTFKKSTSLYNKIVGYNRGLDRDKDGIACEKR